MRKRILNISFTLLIFTFYSCNAQYKIRPYTLVSKSLLVDTCSHMTVSSINNNSIILISDTTLNYSISFGGLGVSTTIGYELSDSILLVDNVDIITVLHFKKLPMIFSVINFIILKIA